MSYFGRSLDYLRNVALASYGVGLLELPPLLYLLGISRLVDASTITSPYNTSSAVGYGLGLLGNLVNVGMIGYQA